MTSKHPIFIRCAFILFVIAYIRTRCHLKILFQLPFDRNILTMHIEFVWELYQYAELEREHALKSPHIDRILEAHRQQPFDIILLEQFIIDFYLGLVHKMNVPFIGFSTCALPSYYYDQIGLHDLPSFVPFAFSEYSWNMNLYERIINWLTVKSFKQFFR